MSAGTVTASPEQPVSFLDNDDVPEVPGILCGAWRAALAQPEMLDDPDDQRADQERLVLVVRDVFDCEHGVARQEASDVGGVAALEEPARRTRAQRAEPDINESPDIGFQLWPVADVGDDLERRFLKLRQRGHRGRYH